MGPVLQPGGQGGRGHRRRQGRVLLDGEVAGGAHLRGAHEALGTGHVAGKGDGRAPLHAEVGEAAQAAAVHLAVGVAGQDDGTGRTHGLGPEGLRAEGDPGRREEPATAHQRPWKALMTDVAPAVPLVITVPEPVPLTTRT